MGGLSCIYFCRLIALDKQTGIFPVFVGETWRRLFAKCVLRVTGPEATSACQDDQLCAGLNAGIDGTVHGFQAILDTKLTTEDWQFLLEDAKNTFKDINLIGMLSTVCHLWPSGARFLFNCYCCQNYLFLRNGNGTASFLHSGEGVKQGGATSYGRLRYMHPPSDKNLKAEFPDIIQSWYADNSVALGTFARFKSYFNLLTRHGPVRGYFPKPSKIFLIVHMDNPEAGKKFGLRHGFKLCKGAHYLGGYIGDDESKGDWLEICTQTWKRNICTICETTGKYPHESYAAVVRAI